MKKLLFTFVSVLSVLTLLTLLLSCNNEKSAENSDESTTKPQTTTTQAITTTTPATTTTPVTTTTPITTTAPATTTTPVTTAPVTTAPVTTPIVLKTFEGSGLNMKYPSDWKLETTQSNDASTYSFIHPELGKNCTFELTHVANLHWSNYNESTEAEYLASLAKSYSEAKILSYTKGHSYHYLYNYIMIVSSVVSNGEQFVIVYYECYDSAYQNLLNISYCYPASQSDTFEPIFNSIIYSIIPTKIYVPEDERNYFNISAFGIMVRISDYWEPGQVTDENRDAVEFTCCKSFLLYSYASAEDLQNYKEPTEAEYLASLLKLYDKVTITSFTKETVKEYSCIKVVSSFETNGVEFIRVNYECYNAQKGCYYFTYVYPASQSDVLEAVFDSIMNSFVYDAASLNQ